MHCNTHLRTKTDNKKGRKKEKRKKEVGVLTTAYSLGVNHLVSKPARHGLP